MAIRSMNQTISLEIVGTTAPDHNDYQFDIIDSRSVISPQILTIPRDGQIAICVIGWITTVVFTYFRSIVYKYILDQYKSKEITEINILTLIVCIVQQLEVFRTSIFETVVLVVEDDFANFISPWFCTIDFTIHFFMWSYSVIGSLGIAIYRIMLIKYDVLVRYRVGEKRLMFTILLSEIVLTAILIGSVSLFNPFLNPLRPPCMYVADQNTLESLDGYWESLGNPSLLDFDILLRVTIAIVFLALELAEIVIYVIFFRHMYKHDNKENLRKLLGNEVIIQRNMKNAMSFLSLFCSFLVESLFIIMILICQRSLTSENGLLLASILLRKNTLCAMAIVEVVTSSQLRGMVFKFTGK